MTFSEAVKTCFSKYATFDGCASRSEYWYFILFQIVGSIAAAIVGAIISAKVSGGLQALFSLATFIPSLAACCRRLHDTGRSGWYMLLALVPIVGLIVIVFLCQESKGSSFQQEA